MNKAHLLKPVNKQADSCHKHHPQRPPAGQCGVNDAKNVIGFVDGHVNYIKIYWNPAFRLTSARYDLPSAYDYKWSAD